MQTSKPAKPAPTMTAVLVQTQIKQNKRRRLANQPPPEEP